MTYPFNQSTMTNELAQKFVDHNNLKILEGEHGMVDLFYPFLLMDAAYQIYLTDIKPIPCKTEMKRTKNQLANSYNAYWKRFFVAFNRDDVDAIVDMMDEYATFISTQIMQLKVAAMNVIVKYIPDFSRQQTLSACFVSSTLAHCANAVHELIFKNSLGENKKDVDILGVERYTRDFCDWYIERNTDCRACIPVGSDKAVGVVIDSLIMRIARFPGLMAKKESGVADTVAVNNNIS